MIQPTKNIVITVLCLISASEILCCYLPAKKAASACKELQPYLVDRDGWKAEAPSGPMECMWGPVPYVIVHHTVGGACSTTDACSDEMRKMQKEHVSKKKWPDVGYHFVIGGDGNAYVGRPCSKMGGHTKNHNRKSIGIAFFGNYQKDAPGTDMLELVQKLAYCAVEQGYLHPDFLVIGHRDAFCSTCPGDALYAVIKKWGKFSIKVPLPSYTCDAPETTTTEVVTTPCPTTTTTAASTTTTTTEAPTTTEMATTTPKEVVPQKVIPIYVYVLLSKKPPCCYGQHGWDKK